LAAELSGKGLFLQPLGRDFLEEPVAAWVGGQAIPAAHAVHGAWEHPLLAAEGRLPDGRVFRSGLLPRSAAGPNWLPFVAGRASATGTGASTLLLRAGTPPAIRQCGARFPSWEAATAAMREACRRALRPLAGGIYPDLGPSPWRVPLDPASDGAAPVLAVLALPDPDGFPSSARATAQVLAERGGAVISDEEALAWWEDHWAQVAREGEGALSRTGPVASAAEIGRVAAVFPWSRALLCLQAVESLCGGPTRALGWMDGPSEAGVTVRWRFGSSRPKEAIHALVPHQVASTVRAMGGRIVTSRWASTDGSDSFGVSGEAVAKDALGDALVRLLRPVPGSTA
jgi:hypothetical protein